MLVGSQAGTTFIRTEKNGVLATTVLSIFAGAGHIQDTAKSERFRFDLEVVSVDKRGSLDGLEQRKGRKGIFLRNT